MSKEGEWGGNLEVIYLIKFIIIFFDVFINYKIKQFFIIK